MPINITDVNEFTDPVQAPDDGDPANGATFQLGIQDLANRTRNLFNRLAAYEAAAPSVTRVVGIASHPGFGGIGNGIEVSADSSDREISISDALDEGCLLTSVSLIMNPNEAVSSSSSRFRFVIQKRQFAVGSAWEEIGSGPYVVDDTDAAQLVTATGFVEGIDKNAYEYRIRVSRGSSSGSDYVTGVRVTITTSRLPSLT